MVKTNCKPECVFCGRSGTGVQFAIFNPRFKPFGTACTDCEAILPEGTKVPETPLEVAAHRAQRILDGTLAPK